MPTVPLNTIEILPLQKHTATLIYFHGLGDNAEKTANWIRYLLGRDLYIGDNVKVIIPTAAIEAYSPIGSKPTMLNAWFNINGNCPLMDKPENKKSYIVSDQFVGDLIQQEVDRGIPLSRIVVGGYSMGSNYALHVAYRTHPQVAGVFVVSTYLNYDSAVYESLSERGHHHYNLPAFLCISGEDDDTLLHEWSQNAYRELTRLGVRGEFHTIPDGRHEIRMGHLLYVEQWAKKLLGLNDDRLMHKL